MESGCYSEVENCAEGCSTDPEACDECDEGYFGEKCIFDEDLLDECEVCLFSDRVSSSGPNNDLTGVSSSDKNVGSGSVSEE